jgi:hypothetical protein
MLKKLLCFASVAEFGTGLALIFVPGLVVVLLVGAEVSAVGTAVSRCFGIGLVALGLACWPSEPQPRTGSPAFRAMLVYNALIALYFAHLGLFREAGGLLLWPVAVMHGAVALLLVWAWRNERRTEATQT